MTATEPLPSVAQKPVAISQAPAVTPMEMLQIAVEKGADLDQLQKLMELQERWEQGQARKAFVRAMAAFKKDPPRILKTQKASFEHKNQAGSTEYDYAPLWECVAAIAPALSDHGLMHQWRVSQDNNAIIVTCILSHEDGYSEEVTMSGPPDTTGYKSANQQSGSTLTYLQRYTLLSITGLAAEGMDDDGAVMDTISDDQIDALQEIMQGMPPSTASGLLNYLSVESFDKIPIAMFSIAEKVLRAKKARLEKEAAGEAADAD